MRKKRMVLLEFNELCPELLANWMAEGKLPNFKTFYDASEAFVTKADADGPPHLNPWIVWYSVHTGLHYQAHQVFHLTDGAKANHRDLWTTLIEHGKTVGSCCSMNVKRFDHPNCFYLPDPWSGETSPAPESLTPFYDFIAREVQEHSNVNKAYDIRSTLTLLKVLYTSGLRPKTVKAIVRQIISDQWIDKDSRWRRAVLLDKLQFDLLKHYYYKFDLDFSTFFLNSTAHFQHLYWRYMEPESFASQASPKEMSQYKESILFGYQEMDKLLGEFMTFEKDGVMLVLATALSQQPYTQAESTGGKRYYRANDMEALFQQLNLSYLSIKPVMTNDYMVYFSNRETQEAAFTTLQGLTYEGRNVFRLDPSDQPNTVFFGISLHQIVPPEAQIESTENSVAPLNFYDWFYLMDVKKSGHHHPDGALWFKTGQHRVHRQQVSVLDIFPTLLDFYQIQVDAEMIRKPLPVEWEAANALSPPVAALDGNRL